MLVPSRRLKTIIERIRDGKTKADPNETGFTATRRITFETVRLVLPGGRVIIVPAKGGQVDIPVTGGDSTGLSVNDKVAVAWKEGQPAAAIYHHARRAQITPLTPGEEGIIEELFIVQDAAVGAASAKLFFRNFEQVVDLGIDPSFFSSTATPGSVSTSSVAWSQTRDRFILTGGNKIRQFKLNPRGLGSRDTAFRSKPTASLERTFELAAPLFTVSDVHFITDGFTSGAHPSGWPTEDFDIDGSLSLNTFFAGPIDARNFGLKTSDVVAPSTTPFGGLTLALSTTDTGIGGSGVLVNSSGMARSLDWILLAFSDGVSESGTVVAVSNTVSFSLPSDSHNYQTDFSWNRIPHSRYVLFVKDSFDSSPTLFKFVFPFNAFRAFSLLGGSLGTDDSHVVFNGVFRIVAPSLLVPTAGPWQRSISVDLNTGLTLKAAADNSDIGRPDDAFNNLKTTTTLRYVKNVFLSSLGLSSQYYVHKLVGFPESSAVASLVLVDPRRTLTLFSGVTLLSGFFIETSEDHVLWRVSNSVIVFPLVVPHVEIKLQGISTGSAHLVSTNRPEGFFGTSDPVTGTYSRLRLLRPFDVMWAGDDYPPKWFPVLAWEIAHPEIVTLTDPSAGFPPPDTPLARVAFLAALTADVDPANPAVRTPYPSSRQTLSSYQALNDRVILAGVSRRTTPP